MTVPLDYISIAAISTVNVGLYATIAQVQEWEINPTTVFGVLVSVLATAVIVLWRSNRDKDKEIKELNKLVRDEIKTLLSDKSK